MSSALLPEALPPVPAGPPAAAEALIYQGPVSLWMGWRAFLGAGLACLGGAALGIGGFSVANQPLGLAGVALAAAGALMLPYLVWSIRSLRYKVTTRLIEREAGLLLKRVDSLDLGRVKDVNLTQSLLQRMLGVGTIEVYSSDRTDPEMRLEFLPAPRPTYERLRDAVIDLSRRRGVIPMN